jgi:PAS domain S-box-containing protein
MTRSGKTSSILLVEDDFLTALAEKASLEKRGYRVVSAGSGEEAVDRCGSDPSVDLILMDIDLGRGIDGPTAAAAILRGREIPIIFLSSHSEPEVVERTETITSYGYILKNSGIAVIDASIKMAFRLHEAKRNLWMEKEHLRTTLNSIGDAVIATDASGAVTRMNPVAERLTGWGIAEAAGRPIGEVFRIVNANTRVPVENPVKKVLESGAIVGLANHTVLVSRSGVEYQIADSAAPIYDGDGIATGVILVFRDVTEEYGVQEDLRRSEELYRSLFENMLNGFAYCRMHFGGDGAPMDFTYLSVNAAFEEQTGLRDVVGRRVTEVVPGIREIDPALFELYGRVSWTGEPERMEYYVESMKMWFMVSVYSPQRGYFAAVFDVITERKLLEEALEKRLVALTRPGDDSEGAAFEELFDLAAIQRIQDEFAAATGVASIITKPDGTPLTAPSHFTRLCEDIIRKTERGCSNCMKSDAFLGRRHPEGPVVRTCLSGGLWDAGTSMVVGGKHIANWLVGQVRDESQSDAGMREYAREIGADESSFMEAFGEVPSMSRGRFEKIALALHTLSKQLSASAYMNLQQARFITGRKLAEEKIGGLLREKELILKEVQHRVKNNLNTIFNFLVLQAEATEESSAKTALKDAGSRVQSILVLFDTLSRSGGYGGVSVLMYLPPLIDQIIAHFPDCGSVRVEKRIEDFVLDAKQLQPLGMIVNELLTNVMKYAFTGKRGNEIVVAASLAKGRVTLAVQDNGAGLPESIDFGRSKGFGLMLVDGLTKQLGGSIRVERSGGTRIVLEFGV